MVQLELLESLPDRIAQHAKAFDSMLSLIPPKYYIAQKTQNPEMNNPYMHNKRKKADIKEQAKKAKKAKLDPENMKSITEIQSEQAAAEAAEAAKEEEEDEESVNESVQDDQVEEEDEAASSSELGDKVDFNDMSSAKPMVRSDITELQNRLQQRIAELRRKRNAPDSDSPKARSRDDLLAQRQKKREERKKALKAKKEKGKSAPSEELVKSAAEKPKSAADAVKMDGDLFFSKVDIGAEKKKKGPTDAKTQLQKVEAKKEKLEKLRAEDAAKAAELEEKEQWQKAVSLASGEKIKDDAKLLKKTIKRTEQRKKKSAEEWRKRQEKVKMDEKNKIKKREENIKNRQMQKGGKKAGKKGGDKKKKARHGFEGAAFGYGGKASKSKSKK